MLSIEFHLRGLGSHTANFGEALSNRVQWYDRATASWHRVSVQAKLVQVPDPRVHSVPPDKLACRGIFPFAVLRIAGFSACLLGGILPSFLCSREKRPARRYASLAYICTTLLILGNIEVFDLRLLNS
ncbi:hypothetical protein HZ326_14587 [Fusarium oxysporum f. sp. albedinis]|nr:hypothetical protein HZ326_14587 [Fusarium oxysporum f. sp. albedinis]